MVIFGNYIIFNHVPVGVLNGVLFFKKLLQDEKNLNRQKTFGGMLPRSSVVWEKYWISKLIKEFSEKVQ